jgi:two-component system response regulator HydG
VPNKPRVLIVDDNPSLCRTMSLVLSRGGCSVSTAGDGPDAIETVRKDYFDVIFMDIRLPTLSGIDTYRRVKSLRPETPVVMMTAYAVEDLVQQALSEGAYGVLYKPVDLDRVTELVDEVRQANKEPLVLIVDDDPSTRATLKSILDRRGYQVGTAASGEQAVAMGKATAYDIVFVDIKLPTINGLETYLAMKRHNPSVTAVMITGYGQEMAGLIEEALAKQTYTCLHKPLDMEQVLEVVDEIWQRKRRRRAPA